jgi:hypothetical protein
MSSVTPAAGPIHLGMDTSKNTIVVGVLMPGALPPRAGPRPPVGWSRVHGLPGYSSRPSSSVSAGMVAANPNIEGVRPSRSMWRCRSPGSRLSCCRPCSVQDPPSSDSAWRAGRSAVTVRAWSLSRSEGPSSGSEWSARDSLWRAVSSAIADGPPRRGRRFRRTVLVGPARDESPRRRRPGQTSPVRLSPKTLSAGRPPNELQVHGLFTVTAAAVFPPTGTEPTCLAAGRCGRLFRSRSTWLR